MNSRHALVLITAFLGGGLVAGAEPLVSGPQPGTKLPGGLQPPPLNVTNAERPDTAGKRSDYVEQFGADPVVLVFVRTLAEPTMGLIKRLDQVGRNKASRLKAVAVLLADEDAQEQPVDNFVRKRGIVSVSLAVTPDFPASYALSPEANVTVVLYRRMTVHANHAFRKGELNDKAIRRVLTDVSALEAANQVASQHGEKKMDLTIHVATAMKWQAGPASIPPGAKLAVLEGDPTKEGPFVIRLKLPDGYRIPPHTHAKPERLTVISGSERAARRKCKSTSFHAPKLHDWSAF